MYVVATRKNRRGAVPLFDHVPTAVPEKCAKRYRNRQLRTRYREGITFLQRRIWGCAPAEADLSRFRYGDLRPGGE